MPWTKTEYPNSMKNLPEKVRNKAIEIANALMEEKNDMDEGIRIATAISRAKDWAANRGFSIKSTSKKAHTTDVKEHGEDRYVIPHGEEKWAVKEEGENGVEKIFSSKGKAVKLATKEARKAKAGVAIQKRTGKIEKRISYNPRKRNRKYIIDK